MLDRRLVGKNFPPALNEVEKGAIRRFAEALGDPNPIYRDEEAARAAGFRGLVAPPTFAATLERGFNPLEALGISDRNVLIAEQSVEQHRPLCAGDKVLVTTRIVDVFERLGPGGSMEFAVVEDEGRDEAGETVYRARRTLIVRPPLPAPAPAPAE